MYYYTHEVSNVTICSLSDASYGNMDYMYGQTCVLCGLKVNDHTDYKTLFHGVVSTSRTVQSLLCLTRIRDLCGSKRGRPRIRPKYLI